MSGSSNSKRNLTIDLLKIVFTVVIVLNHGISNLPEQSGPFYHSRVSVEFFFIVSGYLMAVSAKRYTEQEGVSVWRQTGSFIGHKIALLSPNVFIAWFTAFFVMEILPGNSGLVHRLLGGVFELSFLRIAGFTDLTEVNGPVWYLSAMLLAMFLIFPFLVGKRRFFLRWFAPLAAIFLYGLLSVKFGKIVGNKAWAGFETKGVVRAMAGLCLGVTCFTIAEKLRTIKLRIAGKSCVTAVSVLSIAYVVYAIYHNKPSRFDFVLIVLLAAAITLIFSNTGLNVIGYAPAAVNRFIAFLGEFSLDLYLSHIYWSVQLAVFLPGLSNSRFLAVYFLVSTANALILLFVSRMLRKGWPSIRKRLSDMLLQSA